MITTVLYVTNSFESPEVFIPSSSLLHGTMRPDEERTYEEHLTDVQCAFIATLWVTFSDIVAVALITNPVAEMLPTKAVSMTLTKTVAGYVAHLLSHFAVAEHRLLTLAVLDSLTPPRRYCSWPPSVKLRNAACVATGGRAAFTFTDAKQPARSNCLQ